MFTEILINVTPRETRVAILEDGSLSEILVERPDRQRLVGNLILGRVNAVIPGMQAAFVELGLEKSGFLHVSDIVEPSLFDEYEENGDTPRPAAAESRRGGSSRYPPIDELLHKGQEVLVQISKQSDRLAVQAEMDVSLVRAKVHADLLRERGSVQLQPDAHGVRGENGAGRRFDQ